MPRFPRRSADGCSQLLPLLLFLDRVGFDLLHQPRPPVLLPRSVELLDVGVLTLGDRDADKSTSAKNTVLLPRTMFDPTGGVSGVFYSARSMEAFIRMTAARAFSAVLFCHQGRSTIVADPSIFHSRPHWSFLTSASSRPAKRLAATVMARRMHPLLFGPCVSWVDRTSPKMLMSYAAAACSISI